jgi:hypothetical protein
MIGIVYIPHGLLWDYCIKLRSIEKYYSPDFKLYVYKISFGAVCLFYSLHRIELTVYCCERLATRGAADLASHQYVRAVFTVPGSGMGRKLRPVQFRKSSNHHTFGQVCAWERA